MQNSIVMGFIYRGLVCFFFFYRRGGFRVACKAVGIIQCGGGGVKMGKMDLMRFRADAGLLRVLLRIISRMPGNGVSFVQS